MVVGAPPVAPGPRCGDARCRSSWPPPTATDHAGEPHLVAAMAQPFIRKVQPSCALSCNDSRDPTASRSGAAAAQAPAGEWVNGAAGRRVRGCRVQRTARRGRAGDRVGGWIRPRGYEQVMVVADGLRGAAAARASEPRGCGRGWCTPGLLRHKATSLWPRPAARHRRINQHSLTDQPSSGCLWQHGSPFMHEP